MPQHIELRCLQNKVLYRYPAPLCLLAILKLLSQILLERERKVDAVIGVDVPLQLAFHRHVLRLLEGRLDAIREGKDGFGRRPAVFEALDKLRKVGNFAGIIDAAALIVDTCKERSRELPATITGLCRQADGVITRVVEHVVGRTVVASARVHAVNAQAEVLVSAFNASRTAEAAGVGIVANVYVSAGNGLGLAVRQRRIVQQNNASHGAEAVPDALCTLHHFDHTRTRIVQFRCMVSAPALALEAHTVVHQQYAAAVHTLYNGLGYGAAGAHRAHAGHGFQQFCQRRGTAALERFRAYGRRLL